MKIFKHFMIKSVLIGLATLFILFIYMFLNQNNYIYFPDNQDFDNCPGFADSERVRVNDTRMYYLKDEYADTAVVYYHGNAGSACGRSFIKDTLKDRGVSLLFVEYAGYSNDTRRPSRKLILKDVENVINFIDRAGYERKFLMGTSLGTAVVAYHQSIQKPDKVVLLAPFDKLSEVGKIHYPFLPVSLLLREEYDTAGWLKDHTGEILIVHGALDEIVPLELAMRLYEAIPSDNKNLITVEGASHNDLLLRPEVWETVTSFLGLKER